MVLKGSISGTTVNWRALLTEFSGVTEGVESVPVRSKKTGMFKSRCFFNK